MARGDLTPQEIELRKIISNNINSLLDIKNKKQIDVHNATKIPKSTLTGYVKGTSIPVAGNVQKIADFFGVKKSDIDPRYSGSYNISKEQSSTKTILDNIFNKLEKPRQEIVINTAQEQLDEQNKEKTIKLFPYNVKEKLSAGTGYGYFDDGNYDTVYYDEEYDYDFASWIFGDSMLPDYPNGDVALIKACPFEYDGCVYAVDWDGQSYIKKVYKEEKGLRLVSTNEKYSDKFAPYSEEPRIIGKVVASFTPLEK